MIKTQRPPSPTAPVCGFESLFRLVDDCIQQFAPRDPFVQAVVVVVHNVAQKKKDTLRPSSMWFLAGQALRTLPIGIS
jgi:hypothetical protein